MSGQIAPNCRSEGKGCSGTPVVGFSVVRRLKTYRKEKTMSTREKLIKARLGMLALAEELQNISWACRRAGISRSHFYEIKEAFEKYGAEGLAPQPRRKPRMPNQTPPELEAKILVRRLGPRGCRSPGFL
jgi:hypothetical protein